MKRYYRYFAVLVLATVFSMMLTGCLRQDYMMFEDGEFDGVEFSDYDLMHNAEIDMDDIDRNWPLSASVLLMFWDIVVLKIINRALCYAE